MTTLYVRDQSGFREADASDVLDRAQALGKVMSLVNAPLGFLKGYAGVTGAVALPHAPSQSRASR